jgi:hypothetical protein
MWDSFQKNYKRKVFVDNWQNEFFLSQLAKMIRDTNWIDAARDPRNGGRSTSVNGALRLLTSWFSTTNHGTT